MERDELHENDFIFSGTGNMNPLIKLWLKDKLSGWLPYERRRNRKQAESWAAWDARPGPGPAPHLVKEYAVIEYAKRYGTRTFVETGVLFGEMLIAVRPYFDTLYGIELEPSLCAQARQRLANRAEIRIIEGDSGVELSALLPELTQPSLFWLDGHYSGGITAKGEIETPISSELDAILAHPVRGHVILIDDARCFNGTNDYPRLDALEILVRERRPDLHWEVSHDMIRILPEPITSL
jgi:hypothetical protein